MTVEKRSPLISRPAHVDGQGRLVVGKGVVTTSSSPPAGGAGALPATPAGYITILVNGNPQKIPYY